MKTFPITISGDSQPISQSQSQIIKAKALEIQELTGLRVLFTNFLIVPDNDTKFI